ncbi:uncharacterized protein BDW47DRAFT_81079 [Aspergillus candidus]|uniref:AMP-binding enzyme C-terminal domain-containing protein n=1 Tax=Aspergillus candidus TaxID=41067 RepID=A0A2I2FJ61_ASPCN|nr:hypothetical protein BDW47DRAFT_81079 [Aspergillus candidus]PLB40661.1 hypothetical protein BDW47DRAFT_81079 [Aspergillus candidus]
MEIEEALMALPYVSEAYALGVPDASTANRTAALVRCRGAESSLTLEALRVDLRSRLPSHKLPSLLRNLGGTEEVPKTSTGKFDLLAARDRFFHQSGDGSIASLPSEVQVTSLEEIKSHNVW